MRRIYWVYLISRLCLDGHTVHGIDNLNNYYDVSLKEKRLKILKKFKNFIFYKQDLNNLENITDTYDIAINLAAQGCKASKRKLPQI